MWIGLVLGSLYSSVILYYTLRFKINTNIIKTNPYHSFSVVIPFRNEETQLPQLLKCLERLNYPPALFEILLVDDFSEDASKKICESWKKDNSTLNISILDNQKLVKSPKKSAVLTALKEVKNEYTITTDADCLIPENWLFIFNQCIIEHSSDLIAGPVKIVEGSGFWTTFQVLDMMSLQVIGLGSFQTTSPLFCNAANLCYNTQTLKDIKAFDGHKDIASGDDVFNLEVFVQNEKKITALVHQEAMAWTTPEVNFKALTQQRIRWASKAKFYTNGVLKRIGILVFITNVSLVLSLILAFFIDSYFDYWWVLWTIKMGTDFYALYQGNYFFKTNLCLRQYLVMLAVYPFISSYFALLALNGKFTWKGRAMKV